MHEIYLRPLVPFSKRSRFTQVKDGYLYGSPRQALGHFHRVELRAPEIEAINKKPDTERIPRLAHTRCQLLRP